MICHKLHLRRFFVPQFFAHPKDHWTLQWKGLNLYSRGRILKMTSFEGSGYLGQLSKNPKLQNASPVFQPTVGSMQRISFSGLPPEDPSSQNVPWIRRRWRGEMDGEMMAAQEGAPYEKDEPILSTVIFFQMGWFNHQLAFGCRVGLMGPIQEGAPGQLLFSWMKIPSGKPMKTTMGFSRGFEKGLFHYLYN